MMIAKIKTYVCGKCGSGDLYRDDDELNAVPFLACFNCGNRWPGGSKPVKTGQGGIESALSKIDEGIKEDKMEQTIDQAEPKRRTGYRRIAPCDNCGRVLPLQGHGLCGGCRCVSRKSYATDDLRAAAMAAAKARFSAPGFDGKHHHNQCRKPPAIPAAAGTQEAQGEAPASEIVISLVFPSYDKPLYEAILAVAKKNRRVPDQHILWILENEICH